jgi:hypothetical protein
MWRREYSVRPLFTDKHVFSDSPFVKSHIENIDVRFIVLGQSTSSVCCCKQPIFLRLDDDHSPMRNLLFQTLEAMIPTVNLS